MATTTLDERTAAHQAAARVASDAVVYQRPSPLRHWRSVIRFGALVFFSLFWVLPVLWMALTSIKPNAQTATDPPTWFPATLGDFTLENYRNVLFEPRGIDIITSFQNSLIVASLGALLTILVDVPAGYAFARMRFPLRNVLFAIVIASLIVPFEILLVPNYVRVWKLGWLNSYEGLIIPPLAGAFGVFLMRQFMLGIPRELEDAAKLDGAGHLRILWDIVIPSTRGAIAALAIFTFIFYWNDFTWPYIILNRADMMTVPVALIQFRDEFALEYGTQMAGNMLSALPAIIIFLVAQRMIIRSITLTGIKG
jgi:multiple sugar transport system permease protein